MERQPAGPHQRRLIERLDEMGVTMKDAANWIKKNTAYIEQYIFRGSPKYLKEAMRKTLSAKTGLTEEEIGREPSTLDFHPDYDSHIESDAIAAGQTRRLAAANDPQLIPMYSVVEGGEGQISTNWEVTGYVERTAPLKGVRGGYGMYVVGESMEPAFQRGNKVLIDPSLPPQPGDDVILFQDDIGVATVGLIKRMVKITMKDWKVEQFNPAKKLDLPRSIWRHCHVVVTRLPR